MKLLWLCNMMPAVVQEKISGKKQGGLWVDHVLARLRQQSDLRIRILCPGGGDHGDQIDEQCDFDVFSEGLPYVYLPELEDQFCRELKNFRPDVIHIWGTEYGHTLAMVNAAEKNGMLDRVVIHIQGLCSVCAGHYAEGIPHNVQAGYTFRDFVRKDNIRHQQEKFIRRGELEVQALRKVYHVMGRTDWDEACTKRINPHIAYHFGNETLREEFYEGRWAYNSCRRHRIFASSCSYPVKGFHYLLEAFAEVLKTYPDATLAVPGKDFRVQGNLKKRLRENSYDRYLRQLVSSHHLENSVEILGGLNAEQMKEQYLMANVFVLPSTIENSPNSLGEAMLLGVPCVASDVGGVSTMLTHKQEGFVYQSTAPYMLAHYIDRVFSMEENAAALGQAAAAHARRTHDPQKNMEDLLAVYHELARG